MRVLIICFLFSFLLACSRSTKVNKNLDSIVPNDEIIKTNGVLKCLNKTINYGNLNKGTVIEQDFTFTYVGFEDVKIIAYQASCNCTDLKISDAVVKANDSTIITMIIETYDKSQGEHSVTATIKTNGQRQFYLLTTSFYLIN